MRKQATPMPGRYSVELAVIEETGWSWRDLCAAPADLVEEILVRRQHRLHWEAERSRLDAEARHQRR